MHICLISRLDFGNGLLYNLPNSQIAQLQKLQNAGAEEHALFLCHMQSHYPDLKKSPLVARKGTYNL